MENESSFDDSRWRSTIIWERASWFSAIADCCAWMVESSFLRASSTVRERVPLAMADRQIESTNDSFHSFGEQLGDGEGSLKRN